MGAAANAAVNASANSKCRYAKLLIRLLHTCWTHCATGINTAPAETIGFHRSSRKFRESMRWFVCKVGSNHLFHQPRIKPWFRSTNTSRWFLLSMAGTQKVAVDAVWALHPRENWVNLWSAVRGRAEAAGSKSVSGGDLTIVGDSSDFTGDPGTNPSNPGGPP